MDKKYKRMIKVMLEREESSKKRKAGFLRTFRRPAGCMPVGQASTELRTGFSQSSMKLRIKEGWFLYILKCNDGSFYTGITKDLERRLKMHNDGKASKYTYTRRPVKLVYQENCTTHAQALVRECKIKTFSKDKKQKLIKG